MAVSQLQCLDDHHVNPRINESKPEFLYSEDQRLALETLIRDGREAFFKYVESRALRGFLSDPELETLRASAEPYEADTELFPEDAAEGDPPLSLHYWPDLSDTSIPQMDLGWPDSAAYRGVTRTAVYCQPPIDGQAHIKEVVRRTIAQAQKVIAVAMDVFTDVDIFQDLLDVSFKKKVSVYILLDRTALPHFLSMCQRANMHAGHLKNLRVRCSEGSEFYTRSSTKVKGRLGHRFMFIDGDKAVSGSYSFTWMSSRLDRNLVTVVTGQAVEAFDRLFRILYANSHLVDMRQVTTEAEPEPEPEKDPIPLPATLAPLSAAIAMKLYNPKYKLAVCSFSTLSSPTLAAGQDSPLKTTSEESPKNPEDCKKRRRGASKESLQELPPLHPCLSGLEKVCLIPYLPIWPEPDPPSDVIGFINIRDTSKPLQAHLQRSEMFETSQVIRFSSPISIPKEVLPSVAMPRERIAKQDEMKKTPQDQTPAGGQPGDFKSIVENNTPDYKMQHVRNELNVAMDESGHDTSSATPHLGKQKTDKSEASSTSEGLKLTTQAVTPTNSLILPGSNIQACESNTIVNGLIGTQTSPLTTDSSTSQSVPVIKTAPDLQTSGNNAHSCSTSTPLITSSPTPAIPPSPEYFSPPTPKPRTVQLVFKDGVSDGQKLQEVSVVRRQQTDAEPLVRRHPAREGSEPERNNVEPVREVKPGEAENKNAQRNYQETKIKEAIHEIKATPKSKQASKSGDCRTDVTETARDLEKSHRDDGPTLGHIAVQSGKKKRGPTGFGSDEVTWENGKNGVKQKTSLCNRHTLQKIPHITPAERITMDVSSRMPASTSLNADTLVDGAPREKAALDGPDVSKELAPESHQSTFSSENLSEARRKDLRCSIPDRELRVSSPPSQEGKTPTPDPQSHTPDGRSHTPDFKTPTSDFSDGFVSPRALSSTSDEYFECSDSEHLEFFSTEGLWPSHANPSNISARGSDVTTPDSLAEPASISSSSLLDLNIMKGEDEKTKGESSTTGTILRVVPSQEANSKSPPKAERPDEGGRPSMKRESKPSSPGEEKRTARNEAASTSPASLPDHKETKVEENGSEVTDSEKKASVKKRADRGEEPKNTTETFKHTQKNKRKSPLNAERLDEDGVVTDKMEPSPSTADGEEEGKRTANDNRDGIKEELKLDGGAGYLSTQTIPVENGSLPNAPTVTDNTDSKTRRRPPKRPPPPSQGQKQRGKNRQWQDKTPNPPHMHPEPQQPHPDSQAATFPEEESQVDEKTPFTLTFSHLYSLKNMNNKLPAQSKRGSPSSPAQSRKSSG